MVDMEGNIEEHDVDYIAQSIQNNGHNICNSIDRLTKELRVYNVLKIVELDEKLDINFNDGDYWDWGNRSIEDFIEYYLDGK